MSTDDPTFSAPLPITPRPPKTLAAALAHLESLGAVDFATFNEWVTLNPGGVFQLIRALHARLPITSQSCVTTSDSIATAPPAPVAEMRDVVEVDDAMCERVFNSELPRKTKCSRIEIAVAREWLAAWRAELGPTLGLVEMREPTATGALELIRAERERQIASEGWSLEHDDDHANGELACAAGCYAIVAGSPCDARNGRIHRGIVPNQWPWAAQWWKPSSGHQNSDRIRELVKAGALIVAEIERLERRHVAERG